MGCPGKSLVAPPGRPNVDFINMTYTASAIRILPPSEAADRFTFAKATQLAAQYPSIATEFIARLLEACVLADFPIDQAVRRYLDRDRSVPVTPELIEAHRELQCFRHRVSSRVS